MYKDTFGYFGQSEFRQMLIHNLPVEKFKTVLEIGSYEGIFSCFAAQSFADVVHTIDPFDISDEGTTMTYSVESNLIIMYQFAQKDIKLYHIKQLVMNFSRLIKMNLI